MTHHPPRPPILVLGQYEIGDLIATGGMAAVYRARVAGPMGFEKPVAVKVLLDSAAHDEEVVRMFIDEARLGARLSHPNIASVLDFGEADGRYYLAMEYVDGVSLSALLQHVRRGKPQKPLDTGAALHIAHSVLRALSYAHGLKDAQGKPLQVVHRDVSPQNILLDRSGAVKLCDFGIATGAHRADKTQVGIVKGKAAFMSPEQAAGERLDARSDLYSLALTVVAMLGGEPGSEDPVRGFDLGRVDALECPDALKPILKKALAWRPSDRFQSADEFSKALVDAGLDPGEAGRLALVEAIGKVPVPKPKLRKDARRNEGAEPVAVSGTDRAYRNLLLIVLGVLVLAIILALFGVRLPQGGDEAVLRREDAVTSPGPDR